MIPLAERRRTDATPTRAQSTLQYRASNLAGHLEAAMAGRPLAVPLEHELAVAILALLREVERMK